MKSTRVAGVVLVVVALGALTLFVTNRDAAVQGDGQRRAAVPGDSQTPPYPDEWKTSLQSAAAQVPFRVFVPDDPLANTDNITAVYAYPEGAAIVLEFPSASKPSSFIRQEYIEVWEAPWTGGDPAQEFKADIEDDSAAGYVLMDLNGITALGVNAHSPSDSESANPAFIRFVVDGVDVQISGGESLEALQSIAASIAKQSQVTLASGPTR